MKQTIWSQKAKCYGAEHTAAGTVLYYECLTTGKKTELTHPDKLALSAYIGNVGPLIQTK